ncbi:hypothetical protein [Photorhabdus sp. SF281]
MSIVPFNLIGGYLTCQVDSSFAWFAGVWLTVLVFLPEPWQ